MDLLGFLRSLFSTPPKPDPSGLERPSIMDIVPTGAIKVNRARNKVTIDFTQLNIPFTKPPHLLHIMEIPDTNSMDGVFDTGNNNLYFQAADEENHLLMLDWIEHHWNYSRGMQTVDAVYRIMVNSDDDPLDFSQPCYYYAIHRVVGIGRGDGGRYWVFKGTNNNKPDPYTAKDENVLFVNGGTIN